MFYNFQSDADWVSDILSCIEPDADCLVFWNRLWELGSDRISLLARIFALPYFTFLEVQSKRIFVWPKIEISLAPSGDNMHK